MSVPIVTPEKDPLGGVLLLSPYSNRLWSAEDQAFLTNIAVALVPDHPARTEDDLARTKGRADQTGAGCGADAHRRIWNGEQRSHKQMEAVRADAQEGLAQAENLAALTTMQAETQKAIERLKKENEDLRAMKGSRALAARTRWKGELRLTLEEIARLQNQLAEANMR